jgi:hypothetical protein
MVTASALSGPKAAGTRQFAVAGIVMFPRLELEQLSGLLKMRTARSANSGPSQWAKLKDKVPSASSHVGCLSGERPAARSITFDCTSTIAVNWRLIDMPPLARKVGRNCRTWRRCASFWSKRCCWQRGSAKTTSLNTSATEHGRARFHQPIKCAAKPCRMRRPSASCYASCAGPSR